MARANVIWAPARHFEEGGDVWRPLPVARIHRLVKTHNFAAIGPAATDLHGSWGRRGSLGRGGSGGRNEREGQRRHIAALACSI